LAKRGRRAVFWNEPRSVSPNWAKTKSHAFTHLLESVYRLMKSVAEAEGPVHLIAHSFAAQTALRLARTHPHLIERMTLVAPTLDLNHLFKTVMFLAAQDFEKTDAERCLALREFSAETTTFFDPPMQRGLALVAQDPALLLNYFANQEALRSFIDIWVQQSLTVDGESALCVLNELSFMPSLIETCEPIDAPIRMIWGTRDRVCVANHQMPLMEKITRKVELVTLHDSAHYPHLEEMERFLEALER
jgi:pimeloyl-ACP methyl ester carboxylesterase